MHRLKRNTPVSMTDQGMASDTSNIIYDYINAHEMENVMAMETSLAYQIKKDVITTHDSPVTIQSPTPNVIYDNIDEQDIISFDIAMEASPAYQAKTNVTTTTGL